MSPKFNHILTLFLLSVLFRFHTSMPDQIENVSESHVISCQKLLEGHSLSAQESNNATPICKQSSIQDQSTLPLSGNPYFSVIVMKSQVQQPFQVVIPRSFHNSLPTATLQVVLAYQDKTWEAKYYGQGSLRRLCCGWKEFAVDNHLKIGDGCIFELIDDKLLKFRVQILDGQVPCEYIKPGSINQPINVD